MAEPVYLSGGRIQGRSDDALTTAVPQTAIFMIILLQSSA